MDYIQILNIQICQSNFEALDDINIDYQNLGISDEQNLPEFVENKLIEIEEYINNCCPSCRSSDTKSDGATGTHNVGQEVEADWMQCNQCGFFWD